MSVCGGGASTKQEYQPPRKLANDYFPVRLHKLLQSSVSNPALTCLISWNDDGTCFRVHDKNAFEREIQPTFFNQSKYASFRRQLNLWSFQRLETLEREGFYFHPLFKRDEPHLCLQMRRSNMVKGKSRSTILSSSSSSFPTKKISALHDSNTMKMKKGVPTVTSRESIALRNHMQITNTRLPTYTVVSGAIMSKRDIVLENDPSLVNMRAFHFYPTATHDYAQPHLFQNKVSAPRPDPLKELKEAFQRAILDQHHVKDENDLKKKNRASSCNSNPHTKVNEKETQRARKLNHYGFCNISKEEADYLLWLLE